MPLSNWGDDFETNEPSPIQEQLSKIGKIGGSTTLELHGVEHYQSIGKKGGSTTKERHGASFYREIGRLSAIARKERKAALELAKEEFKLRQQFSDKHSNRARKYKKTLGTANTPEGV